MDITKILEAMENAIDWLGDKVSTKKKKEIEAKLKEIADAVKDTVKAQTEALDAGKTEETETEEAEDGKED